MIGAVRICGRWIDQRVLERLSRRAQRPNAPRRQELVAEFCRAVGWKDFRGRLKISSASVALGKLEKRGQVRLPPLQRQRKRTPRPRGLFDDGQPLPSLPKLPVSQTVAGLRLRQIKDEHDPAHRIWNRLIVREHPLGRRPLVGRQLRYLLECDGGIVGAMGFGPAAYHLECRDQWIGWNPRAREQNLGQVIGLSRFLIRPGLRVRNLASQCYGVALRQVAADWQERYGIKPVLVETYVDRARHQGRSLAAANWRRLGQSKGRGRDDPQRQRTLGPKDVWVYQWEPKARGLLQQQPVEILAPRSVFAPTLVQDWVAEETDGMDLGDQRLNRRAQQILGQRWQRAGHSFYRSFANANLAKRALELLESQRRQITFQNLLTPHQRQTARRMAAERVAFLAQDTTGLSYSGLQETKGLGPLTENSSRGLFLHTLKAFRLDGIPLGTAWAEVWARPQQSDTQQRNDQSLDEKESGRWIRALQAAAERARQMPQTQLIVCGDRESDIYELYDQMQVAPKNLHVLVRVQHDRSLSQGQRLLATVASSPLGGIFQVDVPRSRQGPARVAKLQLRWAEVEIKPPALAFKKSWPALRLWILSAQEIEAGRGIEPIQWTLLSTWPIRQAKMARRLVRWYAIRWSIECWHKVLKVVCGVERRQMKNAQTLERALALDMIISDRVLLMSRMGKEHPDLPAEGFYSPQELEVLEVKNRETKKFPFDQKRTVLQANILTAMLAGFWARKSDGHPGSQILAQGLSLLQTLVWYHHQSVLQRDATPKKKRPLPP